MNKTIAFQKPQTNHTKNQQHLARHPVPSLKDHAAGYSIVVRIKGSELLETLSVNHGPTKKKIAFRGTSKPFQQPQGFQRLLDFRILKLYVGTSETRRSRNRTRCF